MRLRITLQLVITSIVLIAIYVIGARGIADYYAQRSYEALLGKNEFGYDTWSRAYEDLETAIRFDSENAEWLLRKARLLQLRLRERGKGYPHLSTEHEAETFEEILAALRASTELRPTFPSAWASLAQVKYERGQFDEESLSAMTNAMGYGPWDPDTLVLVNRVGLAHWSELPVEIKEDIHRNIERAFDSPAPGVAASVVIDIWANTDKFDVATVRQFLQAAEDAEWDRHNARALAELSLYLWDVGSTDTQRNLRDSIVAAMVNNYLLEGIQLLEKYNRLLQFCPYLPRDPRFRNACIL